MTQGFVCSLCWLVANLYMPGFLRASGCLLQYDKKSTDGQTRCGNLPAETLQEPDGEVVFFSLNIDLPLDHILLFSQEFGQV